MAVTGFSIKIAGKTVTCNALYETTRDYCRSYLTAEPEDFSITITQEDITLEREKAARERELEGLPPYDYSDAMLEITAVQRKIAEQLFEHDTLVFHGSCIAVDGVGYLFTAKSGTGKSTHTRLWREVFGDRAVMVNDDKPFLQITRQGVTVHGSPWNGKHGLGSNISVPLKAVCILARGTENRIQSIDAGNALMMLLQQSNRPRQPGLMPKYLELIDRMSEKLEFYRLECNMDPQAAQLAYTVMSGKDEE